MPILQSWLSDNLKLASSYLDKYEYKAEGLALSNIYFHHLGLIQYYHNKKKLSKDTFEKHLQKLLKIGPKSIQNQSQK